MGMLIEAHDYNEFFKVLSHILNTKNFQRFIVIKEDVDGTILEIRTESIYMFIFSDPTINDIELDYSSKNNSFGGKYDRRYNVFNVYTEKGQQTYRVIGITKKQFEIYSKADRNTVFEFSIKYMVKRNE